MTRELDHLKHAFIKSAIKMQVNIFRLENKATFDKVKKVCLSMSMGNQIEDN